MSGTNIDISQPLAILLRDGTKEAHTNAETSQGAKMLLGGRLPKDEYVRFLMMLWYIYDTLEKALDRHSTYPTLEPTYNPTLLARASSLSADISYFLEVPEGSWKSHPIHQSLVTPQPPEALSSYMARLQTLSDSQDPSPLLAHSYVRYLGDLSGGQSIKRIIVKAYDLQTDDSTAPGSNDLGVSFYVFKGLRSAQSASLGEMKKIKDWFRDGTNIAGERCDAQEPTKLAIVEEARNAFRLNIGIFSAIEMQDDYKTRKASSQQAESAKSESSFSSGKGRRGEPGSLNAHGERTFPLGSVLAVVSAVCLAHFLLVVGGFTGNNGYQKLLAVEQWVSDTFLPTGSD